MPAEISATPGDDYTSIRRIRIHRKPTRLRIFRRILLRFLSLLVITGGLIDLLHPRSLRPADPSSPLVLPVTHLPSTVHLSPFVTLRTTIQWTPVETLSLHHLPAISADNPALFAASPVSRTFYPWESTAFIVAIKHGTKMPSPLNLTQQQAIRIPRFSSFSIHTNGTEAILLEYADGLSAAAAIYAACVAAITAGDPSVPLYAALSEFGNFMDFLRDSWARSGSTELDKWHWGLGGLRRFADFKRKARAAARVEKNTVVTADRDEL